MKHLDVFTADPNWMYETGGAFLGIRIKNFKDDGVVWLGSTVMLSAWDDNVPDSNYEILFNLDLTRGAVATLYHCFQFF